MIKSLRKSEFIGLCLLLFAMFFGSGNLIFPPMLGNQAAGTFVIALIGFSITAVAIPVLGILAVSKTNGVHNLGLRVGRYFSIIFPALIFLAIGPGIAIPRNGSLAFEMSVVPYLGDNSNLVLFRFLYTFIFFVLAYYLSLQPSKLVDRIGKIITPILLLLIVLLFVGGMIKLPVEVGAIHESYNLPLVRGFIEGYNTMDALASLNFGLVIALTIKSLGVTSKKKVNSYTVKSGAMAGVLLILVYAMIAYLGYITSAANQGVSNGGIILFNITNRVFGNLGSIVLILIFTLACLTTVVGLITSVSDYFANLMKNKFSYKFWVFVFTLISLTLANFGLDSILAFSVPVLMAIYPPAIVLIILALLQDRFNLKSISYKMTIYMTLLVSIVTGFEIANISVPVLSNLLSKLPLSEYGLHWIIPSTIVFILSLLIGKIRE